MPEAKVIQLFSKQVLNDIIIRLTDEARRCEVEGNKERARRLRKRAIMIMSKKLDHEGRRK